MWVRPSSSSHKRKKSGGNGGDQPKHATPPQLGRPGLSLVNTGELASHASNALKDLLDMGEQTMRELTTRGDQMENLGKMIAAIGTVVVATTIEIPTVNDFESLIPPMVNTTTEGGTKELYDFCRNTLIDIRHSVRQLVQSNQLLVAELTVSQDNMIGLRNTFMAAAPTSQGKLTKVEDIQEWYAGLTVTESPTK